MKRRVCGPGVFEAIAHVTVSLGVYPKKKPKYLSDMI